MFLVFSIIFNLYPLLSRALVALVSFRGIDVHHYWANGQSYMDLLVYIGYGSMSLSLLIIGRIWLNVASQLGDPFLEALSQSWQGPAGETM